MAYVLHTLLDLHYASHAPSHIRFESPHAFLAPHHNFVNPNHGMPLMHLGLGLATSCRFLHRLLLQVVRRKLSHLIILMMATKTAIIAIAKQISLLNNRKSNSIVSQ